MKKLGAETIIIIVLIPLLMTLSGYVARKSIANENEISGLKVSDDYQKEQLREIHSDVKLILRRLP